MVRKMRDDLRELDFSPDIQLKTNLRYVKNYKPISIKTLLELILKIFIVLNSIEIFQGGSNTDSGSKRGVQCRDINSCI